MQADPVVEVNDLSFSYGTNQVLNGLSLSVMEGEIFGVLGANGSGKTTLMPWMHYEISCCWALTSPHFGAIWSPSLSSRWRSFPRP